MLYVNNPQAVWAIDEARRDDFIRNPKRIAEIERTGLI